MRKRTNKEIGAQHKKVDRNLERLVKKKIYVRKKDGKIQEVSWSAAGIDIFRPDYTPIFWDVDDPKKIDKRKIISERRLWKMLDGIDM